MTGVVLSSVSITEQGEETGQGVVFHIIQEGNIIAEWDPNNNFIDWWKSNSKASLQGSQFTPCLRPLRPFHCSNVCTSPFS